MRQWIGAEPVFQSKMDFAQRIKLVRPEGLEPPTF